MQLAAAFDQDARDPASAEVVQDFLEVQPPVSLADPRDVRVLHGDVQHYNIRRSPRGWLAFDPKGLVGERTYDCANALCNPGRPALVHDETRLLTHAALPADLLVLDRRRVLAFTYAWACLNVSFWLPLDGSLVVRWFLKVAEITEPHLEPLLA